MSPVALRHTSLFELDILESDPAPTFVLKISADAVAFDILFCNNTFRKERLRDKVEAQDRGAIIFRTWVQALGSFTKTHDFAGRTWTAEVAGAYRDWKIVRATEVTLDALHPHTDEVSQRALRIEDRSLRERRSRTKLIRETSASALPLNNSPRTNIAARWEGLQTMMEMSEVGVFEYQPDGKLIHGNNAWYRLSNHPRDLPAHVEFSFMDLAYPDDIPIIMSAWNTLVQGKPVTFEMRWKPKSGSKDTAQWVLSACVPIFDEGVLVSIAGNTIDINAQKRSQEIAQARVEALEQARLSEKKFTRFAQLAPIAIYIFKPNREMQYVNDQFFELTGTPHVSFDQVDWRDVVFEEDIDTVLGGWSNMIEAKKTEHLQFRLKKTWTNQEGVSANIWVQGSRYPEIDNDGNVLSVMGTLFDISQYKWAESLQRRRFEEALEAKRQQENFIDMTSHELRNPLSAVVQCADSVISTLQQLPPQDVVNMEARLQRVNEDITQCIDSLQTIVSCSLHQKRVIDDVLTLSKLDSNLLLITPMRVRPSNVVTDALKMFDVECSQMDISLDLKEDESLREFQWVMLDPSRLLQILINLLTNAIKFTKDCSVRNIIVTLGAAWERPPDEWQNVTFAQTEQLQSNVFDKPEWGTGRQGYIWLKVDDTGCGMTDDEQLKLFSRFTQATPRTHIKYGGSGLGLFISKSLTALQGGSIGVASQANAGSTFAFYLGTRIAQPPRSQSDSGGMIRPKVHRIGSAEASMKEARLNILMVEDNLVNQKVLRKQLQKSGCNVSVAGNGVEALKWLKSSVYWQGETEKPKGNGVGAPRQDIDIILMDIEMPVMDGLTCARLIRDYEQQGLLGLSAPPVPLTRQFSYSNDSPTSSLFDLDVSATPPVRTPRTRLPILAVSANARSEQLEQALAAGMDDAVSKPFRIPELWPKMAALVERLKGEA